MPEPSRGVKPPILQDYLKVAAAFAGGAAVFAVLLFGVLLPVSLPMILAAVALLPVGMAVFGALMWSVLYAEDLENDTASEEGFAKEIHADAERRVHRRSA